jgi:hypothetical protein
MRELPFFPTSAMSRLLCLIVLSLGLMQTAAADENTDRMSAYLTEKFGLATEKAQKISDAVQSAASKYFCWPSSQSNPASRKRPKAPTARLG